LFDYPGGFRIPANTIVPPQGFCVIRGYNAPAVPANLLVQNGGKTVEIVLNASLASNVCVGNGYRLWFPNSGGWFAFYDRNGVPQDAISWGNLTNSCTTCSPCNPGASGPCTYTGALASYANIPANRKNYITSNDFPLYNYSYRRLPDGGTWSSQATNIVTMGNCNSTCAPPPVITCNGTATASPIGGTTPYSYVWNDTQGQTTQTATGLCAGTYCVTVTSANNQTATACVTVNDFTIPANATTSTPQVCLGQTILFEASPQGTGYSYSWSGPNSFSSNTATNQRPNATSNMSGTYTVTVTNSNGCTGSASIQITVSPDLTITAQADPATICIGGQSTLTASGANTYTWSHTLGTGQSVTASPNSTTTYTVTGTDASGCTGSTNVTVTVATSLNVTAIANPPEICIGGQTILQASGATTYDWSDGLGSGTSVPASPQTTTTYSVTGSDNFGCTGSATVTVNVIDGIPISVTADPSSICLGDESILTASGGDAYIWSEGGAGTSITVSPTATTIYSVTGTDAAGCSGEASVTVIVNTIPVVQFSASPTSGCRPLTVVFDNQSTPGNYLWSFGDGNTSTSYNPTYTYQQSGNYSVSLQVSSGSCFNILTLPNIIQVHPNPVADFSMTPTVVDAENGTIFFSDLSLGASTWLWNFGEQADAISTLQNPSYTFTVDGTHQVCLNVENNYGCTDSICKFIVVQPFISFYIPSAFSPNGDGINDIFALYGINVNPNNFSMRVFDRWGALIFSANSLNNAQWDGTHQFGSKIGEKVPQGTYVYLIEVTIGFDKKSFQGIITVVY